VYVTNIFKAAIEFAEVLVITRIKVFLFFLSVVDGLCLPRENDNELLLLMHSGAWTTEIFLPARFLWINTNY
jgi:hypothetical protein